ncbi:hypothetical protein SMICM304S_11803 [Streptomyces microflavus]
MPVEQSRVHGPLDQEAVEQIAADRPGAQCREPHVPARHPGQETDGQCQGAAEQGQRHHGAGPPRSVHLLGAVGAVEPAELHARGDPVGEQQGAREQRQREQPHLAAPDQLEVLGLHQQAEDEERQELEDPLKIQVVADVGGDRGQHGDGEGHRQRMTQRAPDRCGDPPDEQGDQEPRQEQRIDQADRGVRRIVHVPLEERIGRLEQHVRHGDAGDQALHLRRGHVERAGEVAGDEDEGRHVERVHDHVESPGRPAAVHHRFPGVRHRDQDDGQILHVVEVGIALLRRRGGRGTGRGGTALRGGARGGERLLASGLRLPGRRGERGPCEYARSLEHLRHLRPVDCFA